MVFYRFKHVAYDKHTGCLIRSYTVSSANKATLAIA